MRTPSFKDWLAITEPKARYCRCLDTKDWESYAVVFCEDLVLDPTRIWAMQDRNIWPNGRQLLGFGHYHERYLRVDGAWLITESMLTRINTEMSR